MVCRLFEIDILGYGNWGWRRKSFVSEISFASIMLNRLFMDLTKEKIHGCGRKMT